jgi:hypothetical protein
MCLWFALFFALFLRNTNSCGLRVFRKCALSSRTSHFHAVQKHHDFCGVSIRVVKLVRSFKVPYSNSFLCIASKTHRTGMKKKSETMKALHLTDNLVPGPSEKDLRHQHLFLGKCDLGPGKKGNKRE